MTSCSADGTLTVQTPLSKLCSQILTRSVVIRKKLYDVDIFVNPADVWIMEQRLRAKGYVYNGFPRTHYIGMRVHKFYHYRSLECGVYTTVDVVEVTGSFDTFFDKFDMDICTSRTNGTDFIIKNRELAKQGITDYKPVAKVTNDNGIVYKYKHNKDRIEKYLKRGIRIVQHGPRL